MDKNYKVFLMAVFGIVVIAVLLINSSSGFFGYASFHRKDEVYYAKLAIACDSLFARAKNGREVVLTGDDASLPPLIKALGAKTVTIVPFIDGQTNYGPRISIMIGVSRSGFGIEWMKSDDENKIGLWELSTLAEGLKRIQFSTIKS